MILILAEKPSVAKTIASFLNANTRKEGYFEGNNYIVTYAVGHLISLYDMKDYDKEKYAGSWKMQNYPFIPDDKFKFKIDKDKKKQFNIIKSLLYRDDVEYIINATDNDREGELISFLILMMAKNKKPVKRILVNEWTPEDITRGFSSLKDDEEMRNLQAAGYTRLITDWLIGINFTCAATLKYGNGKLLNIGRVILPTVKLIYDRDMEIRNFIPEKYYEIEGKFKHLNGEYTGKYKKGKETKFDNIDDAKAIIDSIDKVGAIIQDKKVTMTKEYAPKLFSLTSLQGYITSRYASFTSDKVLSVCQNLYEGKGKGGYITYPRTDSIFLEESLAEKVKKTLEIVKKGHPCESNIKFSKTKRVFDSSKVESHSAIIPTYILPPASLTSDEKIVYEAIRDRFLANFMPPAEYENTEIITDVDKNKFYTKGKVLIVKGFLEIFNRDTKNNLLPKVEKGDSVEVMDIVPSEKTTTPPKPYTEDTLLKAMKNCGKNVSDDDTSVLSGYSIGTSATRADVLKKIKQVGYVNKKGKNYYITELGINLVEIFPVKNLFDVDFTGKLEKNLLDIQKGKYSRKDYLNMVCAFIFENVNNIKMGEALPINTDKIVYNPKTKKYVKESQMKKKISKDKEENFSNNTVQNGDKNSKELKSKLSKKKIDPDTGLEIIAVCPECGNSIIESDKAFACKNYKQCGFTLWKNDPVLALYKKKPTKTMVKSLSKSKIAKVRGLVSEDGSKFDSELVYHIGPDNKLVVSILTKN